MNSSFEPSSVDANKADQEKIDTSKIVTDAISLDTAKSSCQLSQTVETQPEEIQSVTEKDAILPEGQIIYFNLHSQKRELIIVILNLYYCRSCQERLCSRAINGPSSRVWRLS